MAGEEEQDEYERGYVEGNRRAYLSMLREIRTYLDDDHAREVNWLIERQEAVAALRRLCARFGDNDWPDNLYLADVIEKHLGDYLEVNEE